MDKLNYLSQLDAGYLDSLYADFLKDPDSIDPEWKRFFEGFEFHKNQYPVLPSKNPLLEKEFKVISLINAYRERGHFFTETNPVRKRRNYSPTLDIENFGLSNSDLKTVFNAGSEIGIGSSSLENIIAHLKQTYCRTIGIEYRYIRQPEVSEWLRDKMESSKNTPAFSNEEKKIIYTDISHAVQFEEFLHTRFVGQKRFSLQGVESLIPALHSLVEKGAEEGVSGFIIGMPHRGRLNVLANVLKKPIDSLLSEFEGLEPEDHGLLGDVKYHLGFSTNIQTRKGHPLHLVLSPNPSHLEAVNPVVEGICRALAENFSPSDFKKNIPVLIHGDASIAGQGIVYEVIQMAQLEGYKTGGTIHIVANNQIGFTTDYTDGRSGIYCTDVAKTTQCPIFHVNADDPEAVVFIMQLAIQFRQKFHRDVFIDLLGYRKHGHNEGDEPRYTQPLLYKIIASHLNVKEIYQKKLLDENSITQEDIKIIQSEYIELLRSNQEESKKIKASVVHNFLSEIWNNFRHATNDDFENSPDTSVSKEKLIHLSNELFRDPEQGKLFSKSAKILSDRYAMVHQSGRLDWGACEILAYASLLNENHPVRISGQDVQRGTFSHRHAVLKFEESELAYIPLQHLSGNPATFSIYNSLLSEYGVLGFEYGYSLLRPNGLTIWEAQFGDFANGAQIIFDQFISSAEEKWNQMSGLTVLLPHGFEGQGPEHSSARIERFLVLSADNNMQIVQCSTPANFFHVLRRQVFQPFRKPLIVFTPKSLLRHPLCTSSLEDLSANGFQEVFDDTSSSDKTTRVLFCSGKIYYDLLEQKIKDKNMDTAIVRIEQLYPFPAAKFEALLLKYNHCSETIWVQEEPENMGEWPFLLRTLKNTKIKLIARPPSGSPACGSGKLHHAQQEKIIERAFKKCTCDEICTDCDMLCIEKNVTIKSVSL